MQLRSYGKEKKYRTWAACMIIPLPRALYNLISSSHQRPSTSPPAALVVVVVVVVFPTFILLLYFGTVHTKLFMFEKGSRVCTVCRLGSCIVVAHECSHERKRLDFSPSLSRNVSQQKLIHRWSDAGSSYWCWAELWENDSPVDVHRHLLPLVVMFIFLLTLCRRRHIKTLLTRRRIPSLQYKYVLCLEERVIFTSRTRWTIIRLLCLCQKGNIIPIYASTSPPPPPPPLLLLFLSCIGFSIHCLISSHM